MAGSFSSLVLAVVVRTATQPPKLLRGRPKFSPHYPQGRSVEMLGRTRSL